MEREELVKLGIEGFKADEIMLLQEKMLERACKFMYRKKDGSLRDAVGTLKRDMMRLSDGTLWEPKGGPAPARPGVINYFDLREGAWRSFVPERFVAFVAV